MAGMRPFRFLATASGYPGFAELTALARKAETAGCAAFVLPDHLTGQYAAVPGSLASLDHEHLRDEA
jgi:alkanesulfonate monooxygenase SsuD/methylene tetrahydromethanopterin reductase-like flavin-dependent oxidoreductase (luciferase family)